jgi:DNA-binding NarL/FixJ family response regulator
MGRGTQVNGDPKKQLYELRPTLYDKHLQARLESFPLTERQQMIVGSVMKGLSNRNIAELLYIDELTVKAHLRDIFRKLNIHSRTALIAKILHLDG